MRGGSEVVKSPPEVATVYVSEYGLNDTCTEVPGLRADKSVVPSATISNGVEAVRINGAVPADAVREVSATRTKGFAVLAALAMGTAESNREVMVTTMPARENVCIERMKLVYVIMK